jgi:2-amino-4-hydroxy-6-hydroxymethyldihydropteridine diphosphokinase
MEHLRHGVLALKEQVKEVRVSSVYRSPALLPEGAPADWDQNFYNMALCGECALPPEELLAEVKQMEAAIGRVFRGVWGPREIDIDILAMDGLVLDSPNLCIPHKGLAERDFALLPLAEIAPDWMHPILGKSAAALCAEKRYVLEKVGAL